MNMNALDSSGPCCVLLYTARKSVVLDEICLFMSTHNHSTMYITVQQENSGKLERVRKGYDSTDIRLEYKIIIINTSETKLVAV